MSYWMVVVSIVNLVVSSLMAIVLAWVATRTRKIEGLEAELKRTASELVETQITVKTSELSGLIRVLTAEIQGINKRLERGDGHFDQLGEKGHQLELKLIERISATCATKEDVRVLSQRITSDVQAMSQRFDALQQAVARAVLNQIERPSLVKEQL